MPQPSTNAPARGVVQRTLTVLEVVASLGGGTAKEIAEGTGLPLPTVYRLTSELIEQNYLVHIRAEKRFELGYKLHQLGVSLHQQIGVSRQVRAEIANLHAHTRAAAYLAIHRGSQIVVVCVADSPDCPRLTPLEFGFHEMPHATAFGKILLSEMTDEQREIYLGTGALRALTPHTLTDRAELNAQLERAARSGVAHENGEFIEGASCMAATVRAASGAMIGSVALSAPDHEFHPRAAHLERALRETASRISRFYRVGRTSAPVLTTR